MKAVLINKNTGEIIKHDEYPREDMQPVVGLDPSLEWLVKHTPYIQPDYDSRIFVLSTTEEVTTNPHPDYPYLNQYRITYTLQKREADEIELAIDNAEREANEAVFNTTEQLKSLTLVVAALIRASKKLELTAAEQQEWEKLSGIAVKFWKNHENKKTKKAQLIAGQEPEIDASWER